MERKENAMEIARKEEGRGNKVWMAYGKIRINEQWWKWDEEVLKDWRGIAKKEKRRKEEGDRGLG